jgi:MscS family membrane protein
MFMPLLLLLLGNDARTWLLAIGTAALSWLLAQLLYRASVSALARRVQRTQGDLDNELLHALRGPVVVLLSVLGTLAGYDQLDLPPKADLWMTRAFHVALALSITWLVARSLNVMLHRFMLGAAQRKDREDAGRLVPALAIALKVLVWGLGSVVALNNAGYDVGALLAGIGIGGLAMAMAAKDTVANIFGGITVFVDKPFAVGDRIRIEGHDGVVTEVGIRSTRIRTLEGPVVVIPNQHFADRVVVNVSEEASARVRHELPLDLGTSPDRVEAALELLRTLVHAHADLLEPTHVACVHSFKDHAIGILFIYHIRRGQAIWDVQNRVHLDLLHRLSVAGIRLAIPTSLQYTAEPPMR